MTSSISCSHCTSTTSSTFCTPRGTSSSRRDATATARAASQRKCPPASAPPARTPSAAVEPPSHPAGAASAATSTHVAAVTRAVMLLGVIELPLRTADRPKEIHESGGDSHAEAEQREPGFGAEPAIRIVPGAQADHSRQHQRESDRGQLAERSPGALFPGRRHVKKDTSTSLPPTQAGASG